MRCLPQQDLLKALHVLFCTHDGMHMTCNAAAVLCTGAPGGKGGEPGGSRRRARA